MRSHGERVGFRWFVLIPAGAPLQRLQGARFVEVYDGVKLAGDPGPEVVASALGLRPIDDADGPFQLSTSAESGDVAKDSRKAFSPVL
jgi:hypothetical protein